MPSLDSDVKDIKNSIAAGTPAALGQATMANSTPVVIASNQSAVPTSAADGADVTQGAVADAAVSTDANGTVSAKLRGLIVLIVNLLSRWPAALGQGTMAQSLKVVLPTDQSGVKNIPQGAANVAYSQVTAGASAQLIVARATRRYAIYRNSDAANGVYVGTGTVTSANGFLVPAGASKSFDAVVALNFLAAAGTPVVHVEDYFD